MKKIKLLLISVLLLTALTACKNPMVTTLLIAPSELENITVTAPGHELNYDLQPGFAKGKREYSVFVPRDTEYITVTGITNKQADIRYRIIGETKFESSGNFEFKEPDRFCKMELHVNIKNMDPSVYTLNIYRIMPAWISKMEAIAAAGIAEISCSFSPGFNPSITNYTIGVNFNSEKFSLTCYRREFSGDENINITFENMDGTPINTAADTTPLIANDIKSVDIPFPYVENNPSQTMMEKIVRVIVSFPAENPEPVIYTLKIRRPAKVSAITGVVYKDEDCFTLSGTERENRFKQGDPVTFIVTPPFGYSRSGVSAVSNGNPVTLYKNGDPLTTAPAAYSFIMPEDDVVLRGVWEEIPAVPNVRYVWEHGIGDGSKWCRASNDLQKLIDGYTGVSPNNYEIWIAKGTVTPIWSWLSGGARPSWAENDISNLSNWSNHCFVLKNGVKIYGGFKGIEKTPAEKTSRDIAANETILSGFKEGEGYTRHLVVAAGIVTDTLLEGVTITKSETNGSENGIKILVNGNPVTLDILSGAGIYAVDCYSNLVFSNVKITNNSASTGAGAYNYNANPVYIKCLFKENMAYIAGGGMANTGNSAPLIRECTITGNQTGSSPLGLGTGYGGAGIHNSGSSNPTLRDTAITGNFSGTQGGGMLTMATAAYVLQGTTSITGNTAASTIINDYN